MRSFLGRDILSLKDMERDEYFQIFDVADKLRPHAAERRNGDLLKDKTLLTAFYQPSTRTRMATEASNGVVMRMALLALVLGAAG